jgi:hypothetical protein
LRGVNIQRLFGSLRSLKTVEDFTEFEQRGAYFDGDDVIATKKGVNILDRGHQVNAMAEFQENFWTFRRHPSWTSLENSTRTRQALRSCGDKLSFSAKATA